MKDLIQLDAIDRKLVTALQKDATLSTAAVAEIAGASQASCWRRLKALDASGLFRGTVRLVNPTKIGKDTHVFCNVRLHPHGQETGAAFEAFVNGRDEIVECYSMTGDWDYLLRVVVEDARSYELFLMTVLLKQNVVSATSSNIAMRQAKYTTAYPL